MNRKNVSLIGIILCVAYFIITISLIIVGTHIWVSMLELITMISGIFMIPIILVLPYSKDEKMNRYKTLSIVFVSSCMILTNTTHFVNLSVIEPLIKNGINIAEYVQIGKYPSVITAIDYLAWGLFMGLSFLLSSLGVEPKKETKIIKYNLFICGILCLIGFLGSITVNENLWYIAPMGYGLGTLILCIHMLLMDKKANLILEDVNIE